MKQIALVFLALSAEVVSWGFALSRWNLAIQIPAFIATHAVASAMAAILLHQALPEVYRKPRISGHIFLFSVGFFIPFLGLVGLCIGVLTALYWPRLLRPRPSWNQVKIPELPYRPLRVSEDPIYGESGLLAVLRHERDPDKRLRAVMAARQMSDQLSIPLLKAALKDHDDDVRLLAYSLIDDKLRAIYRRIKHATKELEEADPSAKPALDRWLSHEYWELAFLGLDEGETVKHVLAAARRHAEAVLEESPEDAAMWLLVGRVALRQGDHEGAQQALRRARQCGLPPITVFPYLAEVAFHQGEYVEVRRLMEAVGSVGRSQPALAPVIAYWTA